MLLANRLLPTTHSVDLFSVSLQWGDKHQIATNLAIPFVPIVVWHLVAILVERWDIHRHRQIGSIAFVDRHASEEEAFCAQFASGGFL